MSAAELAAATGAEQGVELGRELVADLGQLPLGDGLTDDLDHRPRVEGGLRQVDALALGHPLEARVEPGDDWPRQLKVYGLDPADAETVLRKQASTPVAARVAARLVRVTASSPLDLLELPTLLSPEPLAAYW